MSQFYYQDYFGVEIDTYLMKDLKHILSLETFAQTKIPTLIQGGPQFESWERFEPDPAILKIHNSIGALNLPKLSKDRFFRLPENPISKKYKMFQIDGCDAVFTGQHYQGRPHGFVRCIFLRDSRIFEGIVTADGALNGWGRLISRY